MTYYTTPFICDVSPNGFFRMAETPTRIFCRGHNFATFNPHVSFALATIGSTNSKHFVCGRLRPRRGRVKDFAALGNGSISFGTCA